MKISIIIPVYNAASFLRECLRSVAAASDKLKMINDKWSTEVICVDDCSTDGSGQILDELSAVYPSSLIVHHSPANAGVSAARNRGLDEATGDWIVFLDADDLIESDFLAKSVSVIKHQPEVDAIIGKAVLVDEHNELTMLDRQITQLPNGIVEKSHLAFLKEPFRWYLFCLWGKMLRRSIAEEYKIRFLRGIQIGEDSEWMMKFYAAANRVLVDENLAAVRYRQHSGTLSRAPKKERFGNTIRLAWDLATFRPKNGGRLYWHAIRLILGFVLGYIKRRIV